MQWCDAMVVRVSCRQFISDVLEPTIAQAAVDRGRSAPLELALQVLGMCESFHVPGAVSYERSWLDVYAASVLCDAACVHGLSDRAAAVFADLTIRLSASQWPSFACLNAGLNTWQEFHDARAGGASTRPDRMPWSSSAYNVLSTYYGSGVAVSHAPARASSAEAAGGSGAQCAADIVGVTASAPVEAGTPHPSAYPVAAEATAAPAANKPPFPKRLVQVLLITSLLIVAVIGLAVGISSASPSSRSRSGGSHLTRGQQLFVGGCALIGISVLLLCVFECAFRCRRRRPSLATPADTDTDANADADTDTDTDTDEDSEQDRDGQSSPADSRSRSRRQRVAGCCSAPPMLRDAAAEARHLAARWKCLRNGCEYSHVWDGCLGIVSVLSLLALFLFVEAMEEGYKVWHGRYDAAGDCALRLLSVTCACGTPLSQIGAGAVATFDVISCALSAVYTALYLKLRIKSLSSSGNRAILAGGGVLAWCVSRRRSRCFGARLSAAAGCAMQGPSDVGHHRCIVVRAAALVQQQPWQRVGARWRRDRPLHPAVCGVGERFLRTLVMGCDVCTC